MGKRSLNDFEYAVGEGLSWAAPARSQMQAFRAVLDGIADLTANVSYQSHTSKSIELPVVIVRRGDAKVTWLDNFHECDVHYEGPPVALSYEECGYARWDAARYCEECLKCAGYSWKGWSEEELNDPRITRVLVTRESGGTWWNDRTPAAKERWLARDTSAEWVTQDWSRATLLGDVEATLAGADVLWEAPVAFHNHEGPYRPNARRFTLVFRPGSIDQHVGLIRKLLGEVKRG